MAYLSGFVTPESIQGKEGFHAIRRTVEGLLYYTKLDKDDPSEIDFDGGNPTDKNGNRQLPTKEDYTEENIQLQSGSTEYLTGDGSTVVFNITTPVLDGTRIAVFLNGVKQPIDEVWTYSSSVVTFKVAPYNGAQIAIGYIDKRYKNNTSDLYYQYLFENGDATYFVDDNGYFVKRENRGKGLTVLASDDFNTAESTTYSVSATTWQSAS